MENWPDILPAPSVNFEYETSSAVKTKTMDSGVFRQRKRFTKTIKYFKVSWTFNFLQLGVFEAFLAHSISSGADSFLAKIPISGEEILDLQEVFIVEGKYKVSALAGSKLWKVSADLVCNTPTIKDAAWLLVMTTFGGDFDSYLNTKSLINKAVQEWNYMDFIPQTIPINSSVSNAGMYIYFNGDIRNKVSSNDSIKATGIIANNGVQIPNGLYHVLNVFYDANNQRTLVILTESQSMVWSRLGTDFFFILSGKFEILVN